MKKGSDMILEFQANLCEVTGAFSEMVGGS